MRNMKSAAQLLLLLSLVMPSAAFSQDELSNNQPLTKRSTEEEARIQAKLKLDFTQGLIDSSQLAGMQRDFDAILVKEDDYKSRGMTEKRRKIIADDLRNFEANLDRNAGVHTTEEARKANGPVFNKNNDGTSNVVPTR
ncbi:MAG TPA: hypothetical protein V6C97_34305 [Oculatellaceae cyanobacterium]